MKLHFLLPFVFVFIFERRHFFTKITLIVVTMLPLFSYHYENMPIHIYRKFHLQKLKIFR